MNEGEAIRLIETGADADIDDKDGQSPMHYAAALGITFKLRSKNRNIIRKSLLSINFVGYIEVIKLLFDKGYVNEVNSADYMGDTPVHEAARYGN